MTPSFSGFASGGESIPYFRYEEEVEEATTAQLVLEEIAVASSPA